MPYLLIETSFLLSGSSGHGGFENIADSERVYDLMTYDEIAIAALVSVSVPTFFINSGGRRNSGQREPMGTFERKGYYTGCVGARFEKPV